MASPLGRLVRIRATSVDYGEREFALTVLGVSLTLLLEASVLTIAQGIIWVVPGFFLALAAYGGWLLLAEVGWAPTSPLARAAIHDRMLTRIRVDEAASRKAFETGGYRRAARLITRAWRLHAVFARSTRSLVQRDEQLATDLATLAAFLGHNREMIRRAQFLEHANKVFDATRAWVSGLFVPEQTTRTHYTEADRRIKAVRAIRLLSERHSHTEHVRAASNQLDGLLHDVRATISQKMGTVGNRISEDELPVLQLVASDETRATVMRPSDELLPYTRQEPLGSGGMAEVYLARVEGDRSPLIWKQAHDWHHNLWVANAKLRHEAELLRRVQAQGREHDRIPWYIADGLVHDRDNRQRHVLIEEFIPGPNLLDSVQHVVAGGGMIALDEARRLVTQACEALEHLASLDPPVHHRDLKPQNIIRHPVRGAVLIDFGLAKEVETGMDHSVTRAESGRWTASERSDGVSGPFTDVFSLGQVFCYLLLGTPPDAIHTPERLRERLSEAGHPEWAAVVILKATAPLHAQRVQSVRRLCMLIEHEGGLPDDEVDSLADPARVVHSPIDPTDQTAWDTTHSMPDIHIRERVEARRRGETPAPPPEPPGIVEAIPSSGAADRNA